MKQFLIIALVFMTLNTFAQDTRKEQLHKPDLTAEQLATLNSKHMALNLDLDDAQRQKIYELSLNKEKQKKSEIEKHKIGKKKGDKLSSEERFNLQNERLDRALAHTSEMKGILNKEQFEKWKKGMTLKTAKRKRLKSRHTMMKRKRTMHSRRL